MKIVSLFKGLCFAKKSTVVLSEFCNALNLGTEIDAYGYFPTYIVTVLFFRVCCWFVASVCPDDVGWRENHNDLFLDAADSDYVCMFAVHVQLDSESVCHQLHCI